MQFYAADESCAKSNPTGRPADQTAASPPTWQPAKQSIWFGKSQISICCACGRRHFTFKMIAGHFCLRTRAEFKLYQIPANARRSMLANNSRRCPGEQAPEADWPASSEIDSSGLQDSFTSVDERKISGEAYLFVCAVYLSPVFGIVHN
jgi:hypothetical protein